MEACEGCFVDGWVMVGGSGVFCCLRILGVDGLKFSAQRLKWLNTVKSSYLHMCLSIIVRTTIKSTSEVVLLIEPTPIMSVVNTDDTFIGKTTLIRSETIIN